MQRKNLAFRLQPYHGLSGAKNQKLTHLLKYVSGRAGQRNVIFSLLITPLIWTIFDNFKFPAAAAHSGDVSGKRQLAELSPSIRSAAARCGITPQGLMKIRRKYC